MKSSVITFFSCALSSIALALAYADDNLLLAVPMLVALAIGTFLVIFIHELGHAAFGVLTGIRVRWFAVGPVLLDVSRGRRWYLNPNVFSSLGLVLLDLDAVSDDRFDDTLAQMSASGPIANILLAVICLSGWAALPTMPAGVELWLLYVGAGSLLFGIINAIPLGSGSLESDGATFFTLLKGGATAETLVREVRLTLPRNWHDRPADWPAPVIARVHRSLYGPEALVSDRRAEWLTAAEMLVLHHTDRREFDLADAVLRHVALIPHDREFAPHARDRVNALTALHLTLWRIDSATADAYAALVPASSPIRQGTLWLGLEAARALTRGEAAEARQFAQRAHRLLAPWADLTGPNALEQRWWADLIDRANADLAGTEPYGSVSKPKLGEPFPLPSLIPA